MKHGFYTLRSRGTARRHIAAAHAQEGSSDVGVLALVAGRRRIIRQDARAALRELRLDFHVP
jgi:hypothetical protein